MLTNNVYQEERIPTQFERFWRSYRANSLAMFGLWCLIFIVLITIFAPLIAPYDPQAQSGELLVPPSWAPAGTVDYFLGTDDLGRDILSRLIMGSQLTFGAAVAITAIAALIGCFIGVLAGMTKGTALQYPKPLARHRDVYSITTARDHFRGILRLW